MEEANDLIVSGLRALMVDDKNLTLPETGRAARVAYLCQRSVSTGMVEIDSVLEGGLEGGNFYLFLGGAKNGKSTILRCLGMTLAQSFPVLYVNFEQTAKNVFAKIYSLKYGADFRTGVHEFPEQTAANIEAFPDIPFYIAAWPELLDNKAFNVDVRMCLERSILELQRKDPEGRKPVVIMENLSDIYNERLNGRDSLVNIVTQTAQDIKNFAIKHEISILLAHHTGKIDGDEPTLDDVRDSKRVVDLAHSIFSAYVRVAESDLEGIWENRYMMKYIAGRGCSESRRWNVYVKGLSMELDPYIVPIRPPEARKGHGRSNLSR